MTIGFKTRPVSLFLVFVIVVCLLIVYVVRERADFVKVSAPAVATDGSEQVTSSTGAAGSGTVTGGAGSGAGGRGDVSPARGGEALSSYRYDRQRTRSEQMEWLKSIVESEKASDQIRAEANKELLSLTRKAALETELEGLVMARGFGESVVFLFDGSALVLVNGLKITQADAARIGEAVSRATGIPIEKISVSNYNGP